MHREISNPLQEVKKKREFSELPENLIKRALEIEKGEVRKARALLRKYFGVFLTNKIIKGKLSGESVLKKHISSSERDYPSLYSRLLDGTEKTILDFGAGVNGFSINYIRKFSEAKYIAIEATGQLVNQMNDFFEENKLDAWAIKEDLLNLERIMEIVKREKSPRAIFLFNVIDALETFEWNYSKKLLLEIKNEMQTRDKIIISFPTKSLSGKTRFFAKRDWLLDFLKENFTLKDDFEMNGERFLVVI